MPRAYESNSSTDDLGRWIAFTCPGCDCDHAIPVEKPNPANGAMWSFNGDLDRPTFSPSLHLVGFCHSFVTDGRIQFLSDCTHALAGQTVDLPEVEA